MGGRPRLRVVASADPPALKPAIDPALRGYHVAWRPGGQTFCPGCGRSSWYVGRLMAECGFCATALPIEREMPRG